MLHKPTFLLKKELREVHGVVTLVYDFRLEVVLLGLTILKISDVLWWGGGLHHCDVYYYFDYNIENSNYLLI